MWWWWWVLLSKLSWENKLSLSPPPPDGTICLNVLYSKWSPALTIGQVSWMFVVLVVWLLNRVFPFLSFFSAAPFHPLSALLAQRRTRHGAGHCAAVQRGPGSLSPNRPRVDQEVGDEVEWKESWCLESSATKSMPMNSARRFVNKKVKVPLKCSALFAPMAIKKLRREKEM